MTSVAPFIVFFVGAILVALSDGKMRSAILLAIPLIGTLNLFWLTALFIPFALIADRKSVV